MVGGETEPEDWETLLEPLKEHADPLVRWAAARVEAHLDDADADAGKCSASGASLIVPDTGEGTVLGALPLELQTSGEEVGSLAEGDEAATEEQTSGVKRASSVVEDESSEQLAKRPRIGNE